jgi:xanthine phosphoribosyltransferase
MKFIFHHKRGKENMSKNKNSYQRNFPVSWEQFHRDSRALAWRLLDTKKKWDRIIAVARGGLIPAAIIARELDIHYVDTICISSYTLQYQRELSILKRVTEFKDRGDRYLIIDDLVDTGKTGKAVRDMIPRAYFATVYAKPDGRPMVDTFVTEVSQDTWVLFPWDSDITSNFVNPIINQND